MTTVEAAKNGTDERRYGNPRKPGFQLYGVGLVPGVAIFATLVASVGFLVTRLYWLSLLAVVALVAVELPLLWPSPAGPRYQRIGRWVSHRLARKQRTNVLVQGPAGKSRDGKVRLPGLGAQTVLTQHKTALGDEFGLVSWPKANLHTAVMQAQPAGTTGRDQSDIDQMVAQHGALLKLLGEQGDVAGVQAVVETAPDTGLRLTRSVTRGVAADAPEYCQKVLTGTLSNMTGGSPAVKGWLTVTFRGTQPGSGKPKTTEAVARDLASRLPHLLGQARVTGAGDTARWADKQQIIDDTRAAYDPAVAFDIEEARLLGEGTGLDWSDVGPVAAETAYESYHHEGACSRTWVWVNPPKAPETERILEALLRPHPDIPRKRVSVSYRPMSPEASQSVADRGVKEAMFGGSQKRRLDARHEQNLAIALKAEKEENQGAVMVRTSVMITVTAFDADELELAAATVRQLVKRAHLKMRVAKGMQDSAFLAVLPLGLVIPEFLNVPDHVRDQI